MSEPIKVGDLVMVVRGHPCDLGLIYRVSRIDHCKHGWYCDTCGAETDKPYTFAESEHDSSSGLDITWLKRIPPLSELDDVKQDEEITV